MCPLPEQASGLAASEADRALLCGGYDYSDADEEFARSRVGAPQIRGSVDTGDYRDDAIVLLFCPTCQTGFSGLRKSLSAQVLVLTGVGYCAWGCFGGLVCLAAFT